MTALMRAGEEGNITIIRALLTRATTNNKKHAESGIELVDARLQDLHGETALLKICKGNRYQREAQALLAVRLFVRAFFEHR
jgi:hypothetical protein